MGFPIALVPTLSDNELDRRLLRLAHGERQVLVVFLAHLAEFERRKAHEPRSFPSLKDYCVERLGLSEAEAYLRIRVTRIVRDHPRALELLASGEVNLSVLARLSPHLTHSNADLLLERARHKTRREAEFMALEFKPRLIRADSVTPVSDPASRTTDTRERQPDLLSARFMSGAFAETAPPLPTTEEPPPAPGAPTPPSDAHPPADSSLLEPSAPEERFVRIAFTAPERVLESIERAKALMRHKYPGGRLRDVIGEAIESWLDARDPQRRLARKTAAPRRAPAGAEPSERRLSRRIPQAVRDEVWKRDSGCCAFVSADGRRCGSTEWLEFDHAIPWALGGRSDDAANVRLLCRAHNQHAAREVFGPRNHSVRTES